MAVSTIKDNTPKMEYVGSASQIHWSQWECPSDGLVVGDISLLTNNLEWHYYVRDETLAMYVAKVGGTKANGTSRTMTFPVLKGHTYKMTSNSGISGTGLAFRYFKFV